MKLNLNPHKIVFIVLSIVYFNDALVCVIILPALPHITHAFHYGEYVGRFFILFFLLGSAASQIFTVLLSLLMVKTSVFQTEKL